MKNHKVYVKRRRQEIGRSIHIPLIRRGVRATLDAEGVDVPCEVSVFITNDKDIRTINKKYRNIDAATDVLSFPLQELTPGRFFAEKREISPETGLLPLGDIIVSVDHVYAQAEEYGHSVDREILYLIVHSTLHLLGYDHTDEGEQKRFMRSREEIIMSRVGFRS